MQTYASIKAEIQKLERQAAAALKAEVSGVVSRIKEAIAAYGLTAEDLGFGKATSSRARRGKRAKATATRASTVGTAKYRDPATGKTWTGHGRPPAWILAAENRDSFLVTPATKATPSSPGRRPRGEKAAKSANAGTSRRKGAGAKKTRQQPAVKSAALEIESGASE